MDQCGSQYEAQGEAHIGPGLGKNTPLRFEVQELDEGFISVFGTNPKVLST